MANRRDLSAIRLFTYEMSGGHLEVWQNFRSFYLDVGSAVTGLVTLMLAVLLQVVKFKLLVT